MTQSPFGFPGFDPSKMDPKVLMQLSQLIQQLPPDQLNRMQTLMHNMMAGFDVRKEMEEFEKNLPAGFREKLLTLMSAGGAMQAPAAAMAPSQPQPAAPSQDMDMRDARLTVLRAVANGQMSPEEAEQVLFHG